MNRMVNIVAHRCGTDKYPEQTLESALFSREHGADYIEIDIRFTKDDVPVISHDSSAQRLYGYNAKINELSLVDFLELRYVFDRRYRSRQLTDFIEKYGGPMLLHIKEGGERIREIDALLRHYDYSEEVVLGLVSPSDVSIAKRCNGRYTILAFAPQKEQIGDFIAAGVDVVRLWETWVTDGDIDAVHNVGKKVWIMAGKESSDKVGYVKDKSIITWAHNDVDGILINEVIKARDLLRHV